jgi:hypothetical protein
VPAGARNDKELSSKNTAAMGSQIAPESSPQDCLAEPVSPNAISSNGQVREKNFEFDDTMAEALLAAYPSRTEKLRPEGGNIQQRELPLVGLRARSSSRTQHQEQLSLWKNRIT